MAVLSIQNVEKHTKDMILFPPFNLTIDKGQVVAVHSNLNVRLALMDMFLRKTVIPNGDILINGSSISENKQIYLKQVCISFYEEGLYERLSILDHFKLYKQLYGFNQPFDNILHITQLDEIKHNKIKNLTHSQKRRVQFARVLFQNPSFYLFEEPDLNVDIETRSIFINITKKLLEAGKSILVLTGNIESALIISDRVYRLHEAGLQPYVVEKDAEELNSDPSETENDREEVFQFNKIPTKINEKIVLFDPPEIDYIESNEGQSNVYIKGEAFPSVFTLNDLEERLKPYGFFRCHRSYIVNLQKVREVITWTRNSYSLVLDDQPKSSIPLSKTKMAQLKEMLGLK
ncbi:ATP-binding cassette domain-containing protein [Ornithinibacillus sp. L9]|uniref:ATP-binding cassette domain-containing protein n=1 Tax=Ornithinibacillus caprae TaxID=2678566 RepID=A0A6N8FM07_9BACI|nr:LytTR family transcriptional regulator DNA-binding domain-containing protein [Ornithinibacillus caprae]MUK89414.1 ATP-binding cassette domain-containing protein [Ornithinibacillus caprae]